MWSLSVVHYIVLVIAVMALVGISLVTFYYGVLRWWLLFLAAYVAALVLIAVDLWLIARIANWAVPGVKPDFLFLGVVVITALLVHKMEITVNT